MNNLDFFFESWKEGERTVKLTLSIKDDHDFSSPNWKCLQKITPCPPCPADKVKLLLQQSFHFSCLLKALFDPPSQTLSLFQTLVALCSYLYYNRFSDLLACLLNTSKMHDSLGDPWKKCNTLSKKGTLFQAHLAFSRGWLEFWLWYWNYFYFQALVFRIRWALVNRDLKATTERKVLPYTHTRTCACTHTRARTHTHLSYL